MIPSIHSGIDRIGANRGQALRSNLGLFEGWQFDQNRRAMTMLRIAPADRDPAVKVVSVLFREYAQSLGVDLSFQNFDDELATLPGEYAPPGGRIFLALFDEDDTPLAERVHERECSRSQTPLAAASSATFEAIAGCVALRRMDDETCEMKRLYVRRQFRGQGVGRTLVAGIIEAAHEIGYRRLRLDTLPQMSQAQALYRSLGFREIPPYRYNPVPGTRFFELVL
jgi:putative acetyltransferase